MAIYRWFTNETLWFSIAINGGTPKMDGFCSGKSQSKMDDDYGYPCLNLQMISWPEQKSGWNRFNNRKSLDEWPGLEHLPGRNKKEEEKKSNGDNNNNNNKRRLLMINTSAKAPVVWSSLIRLLCWKDLKIGTRMTKTLQPSPVINHRWYSLL